MAAMGKQLRLAGLFTAITGCFLVYSLIQERLMTLGFGPEQERFRHSLFIILVNRLVACAVAAAALGLLGKSLQPVAPAALFAVPSIANVLGSASQYEALKYVSFPLQALAKCAKTVPVMAWGLLLGGRRYDRTDYSCAFTVTFGCALFVLTGSIAAPQQHAQRAMSGTETGAAGAAAAEVASTAEVSAGSSLAASAASSAMIGASSAVASAAGGSWMAYGLLLLGAFLLFDGLTSTTQDKLFSQYEMHSCNQLLWVSLWSAGISLGLLMAGQQLWPAIFFVVRHPSALVYILLLAAVSTAVQLFIFYTIQQYGALHFALIMTMRQFLSIVLSCLVFRHDLSPAQWLGTALAIGGLLARGMHRGGLERTSAKKGSQGRLPLLAGPGGSVALGLRRSASTGKAAALLPQAMHVPVVRQASYDLTGDGAGKKDDQGAIAVDVQAGAGGGAHMDGGDGGAAAASAHVRSPPKGSSGAKGGARVATRRKGLEGG